MVWTYLCRIVPTCSPDDSHQDTPPWWNDRGRCRHSYRRRCHRRHQTSRWDRLKHTRRFMLNYTKRVFPERIGLWNFCPCSKCVSLYTYKNCTSVHTSCYDNPLGRFQMPSHNLWDPGNFRSQTDRHLHICTFYILNERGEIETILFLDLQWPMLSSCSFCCM